MAIEFRTKQAGVSYEVRTAGRSIRLYTNSAFHSQYHPGYLFTGAVWDLLSLPSLAMELPPRRVLVLGVAGGTVIHQLQKLHDLEHVTGVELDPVHVDLARRFFSLNYKNLSLVNADARDFIEQCDDTFDYIVDDVFLHGEDDPRRPFSTGSDWFDKLAAHLSPGGAIVQNHISRSLAARAAKQYRPGTILRFETDCFENQVLAWFYKSKFGKSNPRQLQSWLVERLDALPRSETRRLRHQVSVVRG